jgi:hypothetical protein
MESSQSSETRWSVRKPISLDVDVFYQDQSFSGCATRDLGLGGMFVEFSQASIQPEERVDVVIKLNEGGDTRSHRFRATVAHSAVNGLGLAFKDFTIRDFRMLQNVLQLRSPELTAVH